MSKHNNYNTLNVGILGVLVKTLIGPLKRVKCVDDGHKCRYFRYASLLLEQLDIEHPVFQYIVSLSNEFRKQHSETAADDLLFYIHIWTRVIIDLTDMGVPMSCVIFHMKEILHECIQKFESHRIGVLEVGQRFKTRRKDSRTPFSIDICNNSPDGLPLQKQSFGNQSDCTKNHYKCDGQERSLVIAKGDEAVKVSKIIEDFIDNDNQKIELRHSENVEENLGMNSFKLTKPGPENSSETFKDFRNDKTDERSSKDEFGNIYAEAIEIEMNNSKNVVEPPKYSNVWSNDAGVEVINLEMKNIPNEVDDDDDTSWFFDATENKEEIDTGKNGAGNTEFVENELETCIPESKKTSDDADDDRDSDDSGAILTDIENLRKDIESDMRIINNKRKEVKKFNAKEGTLDGKSDILANDTEVDEEFDSCFSVSDQEFNECFEANDLKYSHSIENDKLDENISDPNLEEDEMKTIEFKYTDTVVQESFKSCTKESKEKTLQKSDYSKGPAVKLYCMNSSDSKDECSTKYTNSVSGKASHTGITVQNIDSVLKSIGKGSTRETSVRIASLRSHSRHLQDIDNDDSQLEEEPVICNKELKNLENNGAKYAPNSDKPVSCVTDGGNKEMKPIVTSPKNKGLFVTDTNFSKENEAFATKHSEGYYSRNHACNSLSEQHELHIQRTGNLLNEVSIKSIDKILKDINSLSAVNTEQSETRNPLELPEDVIKVGLKSKHQPDTSDIHTNRLTKSGEQPGVKYVDTGNLLKPQDLKTQFFGNQIKSRMSNILLRSRHMNMDTDISEETSHADRPKFSDPINNESTISNDTGCYVLKSTNSVGFPCGRESCDGTGQRGEDETDKEAIEKANFRKETLEVKNDENLLEEVRRVVFGINFDGDIDLNNAVCEVILKQRMDGKPRLNLDMVDCHCTVGRCATEVVDGVIVKTSTENMSSLEKIRGKLCRALLVNGDASVSFKHKGYKPVKLKEYCTVDMFNNETVFSKDQRWLKGITDVLEQLSINILLVKGTISEEVVSVCRSLDIVAIETIPYKKLLQISEAAEVDMVTYISLATENNVCTAMTLSPWHPDWCDRITNLNYQGEVVIALAENNPQTIVLSSSVPLLTDLKEQELWDCLHKMTSALHCGYLLPGAGQAESECCKWLEDKLEVLKKNQGSVWNQDLQMNQLVVEYMSTAFSSYVQLFNNCHLNSVGALDDYRSKVETLKTALDVAITVNTIDCFISTGLTEEETNTGTL